MKEDVLPEGWVKTTLEYLGKWGSGGTPNRKYKEYYEGDISWVKTGDLGEKYLFKSSEYISKLGLKNSSAKMFPKGAIVLAMYGATIGKVSILDIEASTNQACAVIIPNENIDTEFLYYFLLSQKDIFIKKGKGGAQPNISQAIIKEHDINLPPLPEQQYLSQKLTALLDEVAQTKQRLETIPALLKQFRQSVLADAVSGRLTEEWREENEAILTVDDLTKKLNSFKSKTKNLDPLIQNNKWVSCQLGHLLTVKSGDGLTAKQMIDGEIPVYGGNGINGFHNQFNVEQPTIVIGRVGFYCGSVHLTEEKSWITDNALIVNFYSEVITQGFIYYLLKHLNLGRLSSSTAQPVVSGSKIYSVRINLPTLKEQTQIVQKVETYFALADEIEAQVDAALENVNLLTQSILAKAFSGELSATWRNSQMRET